MRIGVATGRPWFAHYDPGVPHTPAYPAVPLQSFLAGTAARHPQVTATIFGTIE
jgi:long-chain acyl-CoA synthetase